MPENSERSYAESLRKTLFPPGLQVKVAQLNSRHGWSRKNPMSGSSCCTVCIELALAPPCLGLLLFGVFFRKSYQDFSRHADVDGFRVSTRRRWVMPDACSILSCMPSAKRPSLISYVTGFILLFLVEGLGFVLLFLVSIYGVLLYMFP